MGQVLLKASAYVFVIALGYALKKLHFFGPNDYKLIMKIVLNITTPAAVITNFASFDFDVSLLYVTLLGLLCNLVMWGLGALFALRRGRGERILYPLNFPGTTSAPSPCPTSRGSWARWAWS